MLLTICSYKWSVTQSCHADTQHLTKVLIDIYWLIYFGIWRTVKNQNFWAKNVVFQHYHLRRLNRYEKSNYKLELYFFIPSRRVYNAKLSNSHYIIGCKTVIPNICMQEGFVADFEFSSLCSFLKHDNGKKLFYTIIFQKFLNGLIFDLKEGWSWILHHTWFNRVQNYITL